MLKVGVFGVGHLGKFHLNNWQEIDQVQLIGFFDPNDENAKDVEEKYQLKRYDSIDKLLDEIDIADIVTPTQHHFQLCERAVRKGKHVFVEKPITQDLAEAKKIIDMVREANVKMQVGHVERFNPAYQAAKAYSKSPMFIEVHRLSQFNPRGTEVSVILDLMIHDIDIILNLVKSDVKSISASGVAVITDTPDIANVRIEFLNGCVANLTSSRISMKKMRKIRLFQKDAYIGVDLLEQKTEVIQLKQPSDDNAFSFDIDTPSREKKTISIVNPVVQETNAIKEELLAFVASIKQNKDTVVSEIDGYLALEVAHKILDKISNSVL